MTLTEHRVALVADEDEVCRHDLASLLFDEGFETHLAADDGQAFEIVHRAAIDVVFLQLELPQAGGLDLLRSLRGKLPRRVPCVFTAREVSPRVQLRAFTEDAFAVVPKPIDVRVMRRVVQSVIRRYHWE